MKEMLQVSHDNIFQIIAAVPVLAYPFSKKIRMLIGKRDNWTDQETGESFFDGFMVHASHYFHDKLRGDYDSPANGRIQSVTSHLKYHMDHIGNAAKIGLTEAKNSRAVELLKETPTMTRKWLERNK